MFSSSEILKRSPRPHQHSFTVSIFFPCLFFPFRESYTLSCLSTRNFHRRNIYKKLKVKNMYKHVVALPNKKKSLFIPPFFSFFFLKQICNNEHAGKWGIQCDCGIHFIFSILNRLWVSVVINGCMPECKMKWNVSHSLSFISNAYIPTEKKTFTYVLTFQYCTFAGFAHIFSSSFKEMHAIKYSRARNLPPKKTKRKKYPP